MTMIDDHRTAWGAHPPTRTVTVAASQREGVVWHWSGNPTHLAGKAHTACLALVRAWQAFHMADPPAGRGWRDIGYNLLVCPHARVIEGCGVGTVGAHSPSWNTHRVGVQFMVGTGEKVTPAMFARAQQLHRDLEHYAGHDLLDNCHHDDPKTSTECPGAQVHTWVKSGAPDVPAPAPTPPSNPTPAPTPNPTPQEDTMLVKVTGTSPVYVTNGLQCRHLPNPQALADYQATRKAAGLPLQAKPHEVPTQARLVAAYGPVVDTTPAP